MTDVAANFTGSIPDNYDKFLGPIIFAGYARDLASRVSAAQPGAVLELAAGTGILSRELRLQAGRNGNSSTAIRHSISR